ncbi:IMP dehydrogenase [Mesoplasma lactucae]|uniref:Guanosine monophosphate reductase n=1 Tax=Mesoplasma lactucae ATCC 49193 TaxID=81460 RepID=A0A291IQR0_9MOLU|nr:IMP dehydrogenase [Mesoplasma lactucae]ATG97275.1 guanosine monophosphate reductase [Mesoplasma lactucae ATCC 49193]ATZ20275.1 inosine 5'-monophosphate dehydrogenase [Mesoplasma lactucae ATCC 49193]MCL8216446.1 Inosine-5'-monophosphate dehydrogenase [Mesoplasma lactucae ATCC 49193]
MDAFKNKIIADGITFDDVLLIPAKSDVLPNQVDLKTRLTKNINLNIPILSAAMDTVTASEMATEMAILGGAGVIHKNLTIEQQAEEVKKVKKIRVRKVDGQTASMDENNTLIVGAAVSTGADTLDRVHALVAAGVNFIVVDSAHGHSKGIMDTVAMIREAYPKLDIIAGNIATKEAAEDLVKAGANCVKVGIGPGSICTTRVVAGVGVPQISAIMDVYDYCNTHDIPFIADGGIKYSGDVVKALGAGANVVMLGSMLAGTAEAPGEEIELDGKIYKTYVGMGSLAAMNRGSSDRYFQKGNKKLVPEGIESIVEFKGPVSDVIFQIMGGLRSGMGYTGSHNIDELRTNAKFTRISGASLVESHPHDVRMFKQAPNYRR